MTARQAWKRIKRGKRVYLEHIASGDLSLVHEITFHHDEFVTRRMANFKGQLYPQTHRFVRVVAAIITFLLTGCASTEIYENGQRVFKTQADIADVTFQTTRTSFHAAAVSHSNATLAGGQAAVDVLTGTASLAGAIGTAIVTSGIANAHPTTAVVGMAAPAAVSVAKPSRLAVVPPRPAASPQPTPKFRARPELRD